MNVLSLFDGMSCMQIALSKAGAITNKYYASEVNPYACKVTQANYPNTIQLGDIRDWQSWDIEWNSIDLVVAGSPCQGFSFAGKQLNFEDHRSKLFFKFVEIIEYIQTRYHVYFLLENVKMKKKYCDVISKCLNVEPIEINSALVSAQNRKRLYWTNIPNVTQPEDRHIFLKDIIETGVVDRDKNYCIDTSYFKRGNLKSYFEKHRRQLVFADKKSIAQCSERGRRLSSDGTKRDDKKGTIFRGYEINLSGKSNCLSTVSKDTFLVEDLVIRKLTPIECERLQTVPDNYTNHVSNAQRYKMLGNGFTVDVITHIIQQLIKHKLSMFNITKGGNKY